MDAVLKVAPIESMSEGAFELALDDLRFGETMREQACHDDHVAVLVELAAAWPPILVWGPDNLVVDGAHRVAAARRLGRDTIEATRFPGTAHEAFVEAIRRNVTHGLPLTVSERVAATRVLLQRHPEWSDRRISGVCALSAKTVARLRPARDAHAPGEEPRVRVGRDGRNRPVQPAEVRIRILNALVQRPEGSLRSIAAEVGASPETVRTVRNSLGQDRDRPATHAVPPPPVAGATRAAPPVLHVVPETAPPQWGRDLAFSSTSPGQDFAAWFDASTVGEEWRGYLHAVPISRVYEIADEARERATAWSRFAQSLEARVKGRGSMRA